MTLYALDNVDDALDVTRTFLRTLDRTTWMKLAVVVLFIGGPGANLTSFQFNAPTSDSQLQPNAPPADNIVLTDIEPGVGLIVAFVIGIIVLLILALLFVGSVFEFVFVESLRANELRIRRYWSRYWRQGLRLFGFRLLVGLFVLGSVLLSVGIVLFPLVFGSDAGTVSIPLLVLFVPLFIVLGVVFGLVNGFTTVFVVPVMLLEDRGVLAGWRRLWSTITSQWKQYLAYAVVGFVLTAVGAILVGIVVVILAVILLVPFGILAAVGIGALFVFEPLGIGLLVVLGILYGLSIVAVAAIVQVPIQAYLRYYALLVLGDIDGNLDLIPDQRAAVRNSPTNGE